jgi:lysophospholipase L1-like esterase
MKPRRAYDMRTVMACGGAWLLGMLLACGPAPVLASRVLVCLGDSNTAPNERGAWCERLGAQISPYGWSVRNYAVSGAVAQDGELGIFEEWRNVERDGVEPNLVLVLAGANDIIWLHSAPSFVASEILRFRDALTAQGVAVWLAPYHNLYTADGTPRPDITELNRLLRLNTPNRAWLRGFNSKIRWPEHYDDSIHYNEAGSQKKADLAFRKMKRQRLLWHCVEE